MFYFPGTNHVAAIDNAPNVSTSQSKYCFKTYSFKTQLYTVLKQYFDYSVEQQRVVRQII